MCVSEHSCLVGPMYCEAGWIQSLSIVSWAVNVAPTHLWILIHLNVLWVWAWIYCSERMLMDLSHSGWCFFRSHIIWAMVLLCLVITCASPLGVIFTWYYIARAHTRTHVSRYISLLFSSDLLEQFSWFTDSKWHRCYIALEMETYWQMPWANFGMRFYFFLLN